MNRVILVHRWGGGPGDDWRPWLMHKLEERGFVVLNPEMPDTEEPVIEKWVSKLAEVVETPDSQTFFVGHSIGCQTILRYLETINTQVGGALFVAGWFDLENLEDEDMEIARPWIETPIDAEKIKSVLPQSILLISNNDPFGALEMNIEKFSECGARTIVIENAGHFTDAENPTILTNFENLLNQRI